MKVLKNYKLLKTGGFEEYKAIEIRYDDTDVFAEMPICLVDFGVELNNPVIIGFNQANIATVIEKELLLERLKETKKIYFELDEHRELRVVHRETNLFIRLPLEADENSYVYELKNGEIYLIEKTNNSVVQEE